MNNYDMSSKGEKIELSVFYDNDLSSIYYNDFINGSDGNSVYKLESSREVIGYLIGDHDQPYYKKSQLAKMKKADLQELWFNYEYGYNDNGYSKADLIADLEGFTIARYYDYIFRELRSSDIDDHIKHPYFESKGYSQGDSVYIIDVGADYDVLARRAHIDHILWDSPIRLDLTVNDDSELGYELLNNDYEYDRGAIINSVNELDISDYAKKWISKNLPDQPEYN